MIRMDGYLIVINPGSEDEVELDPSSYRPGGLALAIGDAVLKAMEAAGGDTEVTVANFAQ